MSQGLPITQLELTTMAFVVCALIIYILWWDKPFGVDRRTILTANTYEWEKDRKNFNSLSPITLSTRVPNLDSKEFFEICIDGFNVHHIQTVEEILRSLIGQIFGRPGWAYPSQDAIRSLAFYTSGTIFSAFHIGAWNWDFPSPIIRRLWRAFALAATCTSPVTLVLMLFFLIIRSTNRPDFISNTLIYLFLLVFLTYIIARLALIILIFYCFSSMPAGVYKTVDWTKFLPHFS